MWPSQLAGRSPAVARAVLLGWAVVLAVAARPGRADAGFTFRLEPTVATLEGGKSKQFTVYMDADPGSFLVAYNLRLELHGQTDGVGFTAATLPPAALAYIFPGNDPSAQSFGGVPLDPDPTASILPPDFSISSHVLAVGLFDYAQDLVPVDAGGTWAIAVVTVSNWNSPGGGVTIQFNSAYSELDSALNDAGFAKIPDIGVSYPGPDDYTVAVLPADVTATPAPPGAVLLGVGGGCLVLTRLRRRAA